MTTTRTKRLQAAHHNHAFEQGVTALTILSRLHGRGVTPEEIRQHCNGDIFDAIQMLNCGRAFGMNLRAHNCDWRGLSRLSLPAIAVLRAGGFLLLGQIVEDRVVVADLTSRRPRYMSQTELERLWDGRVVALAPRRTLDPALGRARLRKLLASQLRLDAGGAAVARVAGLAVATIGHVRTFAERLCQWSPRRTLKEFPLGPSRLRKVLDYLPRGDAGGDGGARVAGLAIAAVGHVRSFAERPWRWLRSILDNSAHHGFEPNDAATPQDPAETESALMTLVILLRCHGIGAEPDEQIRHRIGSPRIGVGEMLRARRKWT